MDTLLDHLCRFTVRAPATWRLAAFLGSMPRGSLRSASASRYFRGSAAARGFPRASIPTPLQRALPSARARFAPPSPLRSGSRCRNLQRLPIGLALRLILRTRLTLIRLALIRNPWSSGGRVSRPPSRYLCLHLLFHPLQRPSRDAFRGAWNAPLPPAPSGAGPRLRRHASCPLIIHARALDQ